VLLVGLVTRDGVQGMEPTLFISVLEIEERDDTLLSRSVLVLAPTRVASRHIASVAGSLRISASTFSGDQPQPSPVSDGGLFIEHPVDAGAAGTSAYRACLSQGGHSSGLPHLDDEQVGNVICSNSVCGLV
jgi:hypothetical protein